MADESGKEIGMRGLWADTREDLVDATKTNMTSPVVDVNVRQPDELSFVDKDIRELFAGCSYIMGMPLMAQLIKELRLWREAWGQGWSLHN